VSTRTLGTALQLPVSRGSQYHKPTVNSLQEKRFIRKCVAFAFMVSR